MRLMWYWHFILVCEVHNSNSFLITLIQVAEQILNNKQLEFYKWDGDLSQLLQNVREKLNKVAEVISCYPQYCIFLFYFKILLLFTPKLLWNLSSKPEILIQLVCLFVIFFQNNFVNHPVIIQKKLICVWVFSGLDQRGEESLFGRN